MIRFSEEKEKQIKQYIEKGHQATWIARKVGCDYKAVRRRMWQQSQPTKPIKRVQSDRRPLSEADITDMYRMFDEGMTNAAISQARGWHERTVAKYRRQRVPVATPVLVEGSESGTAEFISTVEEALAFAQTTPREVTIQLDDAAGKFVRECADAFILSDEMVVRRIFERGLARTKEIFQ